MSEKTDLVKKRLLALESEHQEKVAAINQRIAGLHASGFRFVQAEEDKLSQELAAHQRAYEASVEHLQVQLSASEDDDTITLRAQLGETLSKAAELTAAMKEQAYKAWIGKGGLPGEFEQAWPMIRNNILTNEAAVAVSREPVNKLRL